MKLSTSSAARSAFQVQPFARPGFRTASLVAALLAVFGGLSYSSAAEIWHDIRQAGAVHTTYLIVDHEAHIKELLKLHEAAQLDLVHQIAAAGVPAMMAMDNLDTAFHTPRYVEEFSASFYEQASRICHEHGSTFFIHACGRQKANLRRIDSLGVDGLEGVAYPPLGDVTLDEALRLTRDRFIITRPGQVAPGRGQ